VGRPEPRAPGRRGALGAVWSAAAAAGRTAARRRGPAPRGPFASKGPHPGDVLADGKEPLEAPLRHHVRRPAARPSVDDHAVAEAAALQRGHGGDHGAAQRPAVEVRLGAELRGSEEGGARIPSQRARRLRAAGRRGAPRRAAAQGAAGHAPKRARRALRARYGRGPKGPHAPPPAPAP
jgi:hypothetical protein